MVRTTATKICGYSTLILSLGCSRGQEAYPRLQGACLERGVLPVLLVNGHVFISES